MKTLAKILRLDFLPHSVNLGLLALRVWVGLSMLLLHGWDKFTHFSEKSENFLNLFGLSSKISLSMAIFGELVCSALLIVGLFTRFAALGGAITMSVAFFLAHKAVLKGQGSGELAFIYLAAFITIFIAGGGRFSLDAKMGGKV
jgi:putative oxidoreductase